MNNFFLYSLNDIEIDFLNYNKKLIILIKIIILYLLLSIKKANLFIPTNIVEIDNKINEALYERDLDFSKYSTEIKVIAIYFPQFIYFKDKFTFHNKELNEWQIIEQKKPLFDGHNQPRKIDPNFMNYNFKNITKTDFIKNQIKLAKKHGIFGFAINYYWFSGKKIYDDAINIFLENKDINFPFFLIWKNNKYELKYEGKNNSIIIENKYKSEDAYKLMADIKKYLIYKFYIKIKLKPILAIYEPLRIPNLSRFLSDLRNSSKYLGINGILILGTMNEIENLNYTRLFDYCFEFPPKNINFKRLTRYNFSFYYEGLIFKAINQYNNNKTYRGVILEWDNTPKNKEPKIFTDYSPKKLYFLIRLLTNSSEISLQKNKFLFVIFFLFKF